jgi:hypothetical protein
MWTENVAYRFPGTPRIPLDENGLCHR